MRDIWNKDPIKWSGMSLLDRLEYLRKWYCTGPCGQSSSVLGTRSTLDTALREAAGAIKLLQEQLALAKQESINWTVSSRGD